MKMKKAALLRGRHKLEIIPISAIKLVSPGSLLRLHAAILT